MKKISLIAALTLSTMLSACGGGGGGHGYVPTTTLPTIPDEPSVSENSKFTSMVTTDETNKEARDNAAYEAANEANSYSSGVSVFSSMKKRALAPSARNGNIDVDAAYENLNNYLIKGELDNVENIESLVKALALAGVEVSSLPEADKLLDWIQDKENWPTIHLKAQRVYDMYGKEKLIAQDNAKIAMVNIDADQDSYISLRLNSSGNIDALYVDVDVEHPDARRDTMNLKKIDEKGRAVFEKNGPTYVWGINFENGPRVWLEIWDKFADTTSAEGWQKLLEAMVEEVENDYNGDDKQKYINEIKALKLANFKKCDTSECMNTGYGPFYGGFDDAPATVTYESYAKKVGETGLKYSDFGTVVVNSWEGVQFNNDDTFVFAGGYDAKHIKKEDLSGKMTFEGKAAATVLNQDETTGTRVQHSKIYDGSAELVFDKGNETLTTKFDGWYDVVVTSNGNDNYNITFENGNKISEDDAKYFKYTTHDDTFTKEKFVGRPTGEDYPYGAVNIGYYGDDGTPSEATGYVAYGEKDGDIDIHSQISFGAVKK